MANNFHVIIPAAGTGTRMGGAVPKQYMALHGQALIEHVIQVFDHSPMITSVHVVLSPEDSFWRDAFMQQSSKTFVHRCGGQTRSETVLNGLQVLNSQASDDDWVLVHDAARPGITQALLHHLLLTLQDDDVGGLLALPVADTLKKADARSKVAKTISRQMLWQAQTPQMFRYALLKRALLSFDGAPTDESEAIEALGLNPTLVMGDMRNLKVTYSHDLTLLSALFHFSNQ